MSETSSARSFISSSDMLLSHSASSIVYAMGLTDFTPNVRRSFSAIWRLFLLLENNFKATPTLLSNSSASLSFLKYGFIISSLNWFIDNHFHFVPYVTYLFHM